MARLAAEGMHAHPVPGTPIAPEVAARLVLGTRRIGGLYATGGDIAAEITKALGAASFEIDAEVLPLAAVACLEHLNHVLATGRKNP